jgi:hypothetical protein
MICLTTPLAFLFIDCPGGHNHVQMRMIFKLTIMGMQDGMSTDPSLELWITAGKAIDGLPTSFDQ